MLILSKPIGENPFIIFWRSKIIQRRHHELGWNFFGFSVMFRPPYRYSTKFYLRLSSFKVFSGWEAYCMPPHLKLQSAKPISNRLKTNFILWAGSDDNTNKSSIYFLVVLPSHLEPNISDYMKFDIFHRFDIFHQA